MDLPHSNNWDGASIFSHICYDDPPTALQYVMNQRSNGQLEVSKQQTNARTFSNKHNTQAAL